jgi:hypothetical protein
MINILNNKKIYHNFNFKSKTVYKIEKVLIDRLQNNNKMHRNMILFQIKLNNILIKIPNLKRINKLINKN